jgi:hypothetical protein
MKNIAVLFHGKLRDKEIQYRKEISELVFKHFNDSYPDFNIDYFGHIWDENNVDYSCYGNNIISEKNVDYHNIIKSIHNTAVDTLSKSDSIHNVDSTKFRMFAQISNVISICKSIDFFNDTKTKTYDYVILFRYDYIIFEKIQPIHSIDENTFYLNKHGQHDSSGDNIFILSENKLHYFHNLLQDISDGKINLIFHLFYYDYFVNFKKMKYEILNYNVGVNCEQVTLLHVHYNSNQVLRDYMENYKHLIALTSD